MLRRFFEFIGRREFLGVGRGGSFVLESVRFEGFVFFLKEGVGGVGYISWV